MLLCAGITLLSFKYSHQSLNLIKVIVTKLKQRSQSASNFIISSVDKSTSETLRDKSDINLISVHVPCHLKPESDNDFGHYLAGLIDGDGHFSNAMQLVIVFNELDAFLAYYIKGRIEYGNVYKVKNKKAVILVVSNQAGICKVLELVNGKIRSKNKLDQINKNILSKPYFKQESLLRSPFTFNTDMNLSNHWLSGFSDTSSATFQIQLLTRTNLNLPYTKVSAYPVNLSGTGLSLPSSIVALTSKGKAGCRTASRTTLKGGEGNKTPISKALPETSLVVWGQNLSSSIGLGRFTKQESNMIRISAFQESVITGLMLSDGWLTFASKGHKSARLGFKQSLSHFGYFWFVFSILSPYCSSIPTFISATRKETKIFALQIFTRSLPCFTELHAIYYPNGIKKIPADIFNLLTPVALAHLIMGDGNLNRHGLTISSESFSVNDTVRLLNVLMVKYRLNCSIRKHSIGYNIYIKEKSMPLLRTIVLPHMHSSMLYKLRINPDPYVKYTNQVNDKSKTFLPKAGKNILETKENASFQINNETEVRLNFQIDQKKNDLLILIKNFLGGNIGYRESQDTYYYGSTSFGSAKKVVNYFDHFHLLSSKHVNYLKWRKAYILIQNKEHLTAKGLIKIYNIKKSMNSSGNRENEKSD